MAEPPPPPQDDDRTIVRPSSARRDAGAPGHMLPVGTRLREYEITGLIGEGGFGIVYLAEDVSLQRRVAVKEYMPSSMASRVGGSMTIVVKSERHRETFAAGLKSFVNEARLLARFDHPALVKVYRFWEENGTAYMAMPYYEGPTLKSALAARRDPPDETTLRTLLRPLLDALSVMHAAQCYHRDIAPDNILLTATGPLLLDFGAARRVIGDMTHALTVVLKPGYAPIEQYGDVATMSQGAWTDLYALACVLYFAITGKVPMSSVERLMDDRLEPLSRIAAGRYSPGFLKAIDAALAVRPQDRPQSDAAFRAMLDEPMATAPPSFAFSPTDDAVTRILPRTGLPLPTQGPTQRNAPVTGGPPVPTMRQGREDAPPPRSAFDSASMPLAPSADTAVTTGPGTWTSAPSRIDPQHSGFDPRSGAPASQPVALDSRSPTTQTGAWAPSVQPPDSQTAAFSASMPAPMPAAAPSPAPVPLAAARPSDRAAAVAHKSRAPLFVAVGVVVALALAAGALQLWQKREASPATVSGPEPSARPAAPTVPGTATTAGTGAPATSPSASPSTGSADNAASSAAASTTEPVVPPPIATPPIVASPPVTTTTPAVPSGPTATAPTTSARAAETEPPRTRRERPPRETPRTESVRDSTHPNAERTEAPRGESAAVKPATTPNVQARCSDILQKASLESLTAEENAFLRRECR